MKISYDYTEFLQEFTDELDEGVLTLEDEVLILRGEPLPDGYKPVIDWYYDENRQFAMFAEEDEDGGRRQFAEDFDKLEPVNVRDLLHEMRQRNAII
jgi:hypothetical protein